MRRFRIVRDLVKVDKRDALRLAFKQGVVDTNTEIEGNSLLHYVSREGSEDCLRYLLEEAFHEFPYKSLNKDRNTILHWAVRGKRMENVQIILNFLLRSVDNASDRGKERIEEFLHGKTRAGIIRMIHYWYMSLCWLALRGL